MIVTGDAIASAGLVDFNIRVLPESENAAGLAPIISKVWAPQMAVFPMF